MAVSEKFNKGRGEFMKNNTAAAYLAPVFFLAMAGLRIYLEMGVFASAHSLSYYLFWHHLLWYLSATLACFMVLHLILGTPFKKLVLLFYISFIFLIPVAYAWLTQTPLKLKYLNPEPAEILKSALFACFFHPDNKPQYLEILVIDLGIFLYGWFLSKSIKKAFLAFTAVHLTLTLFGIHWFHTRPGTKGVIRIPTRLPNHVWMAFIWMFSATALAQMTIVKSYFQTERASVITGVIAGLALWGVAVTGALLTMPGLSVFDKTAVCFFFYSVGFILGYTKGKGYKGLIQTPPVTAVLISGLIIQFCLALPVFLNLSHFIKPVRRVFPF